MPSLNLSYGPAGPLVQVEVGLSQPRTQALIAAGQTPPPHVSGTFLIDTGASGTCVDPDLVAPLGLSPSGAVLIQTPSTAGTPHSCYEYDVLIHIPASIRGQAGYVVPALPVLETHLRSQGIDGLIGRDVLAGCVFIVNGPIGFMTLSY